MVSKSQQTDTVPELPPIMIKHLLQPRELTVKNKLAKKKSVRFDIQPGHYFRELADDNMPLFQRISTNRESLKNRYPRSE